MRFGGVPSQQAILAQSAARSDVVGPSQRRRSPSFRLSHGGRRANPLRDRAQYGNWSRSTGTGVDGDRWAPVPIQRLRSTPNNRAQPVFHTAPSNNTARLALSPNTGSMVSMPTTLCGTWHSYAVSAPEYARLTPMGDTVAPRAASAEVRKGLNAYAAHSVGYR